ncbi:MAG: cobalt transporter CbiM [Euryarchaeota archaeon]|nr:cobalt transporter CbiM [Euryarchaeota archaeon]
MHIPDGFIPLSQAAIYALIALIFVARSLRWAREEFGEVPLLATLAAGIFAIQALNIPIPWGTSGHMTGGVLAAILLGSPWGGVLILTLVLVVQALFFADGGITVLGANILNMGVISSFLGYYTYLALRGRVGVAGASLAGAWLGLVAAALATALELAIAGTFPLREGLLFMGMYHAVIGLVAEGALTALVVTTVLRVSPEILPARAREVA